MSKLLQSCVRIRPIGVGGDPATGPACLTVKGTTGIEMDRPNEPVHQVDDVFTETATNDDVWRRCGEPAFAAASKAHSVLAFFGEVASGKSYTAESIVEKVVERLAGNTDAHLTIVGIRADNVLDLAKLRTENIKMRIDEKSINVDGATTVKIESVEAGMEHVKLCLDQRAAYIQQNDLPPHFIDTIYIFFTGVGTLTIVDCSGSDRVLHVGYNPNIVNENKTRVKTLKAYSRCWLDAATTSDPKALGFKDSKLSRFLTTGLSAAMEGTGYAAQIVTVRNVQEAFYETMLNVTYAEACVKQEGLKSVSEYKERIEEMEERRDTSEKEKNKLQEELKSAEAAATRAKAEVDEKLKNIEAQKAGLASKVAAARAANQVDLDAFKKTLEQEKAAHQKKQQEEINRMRNLASNAPAQAEAEIKKRTEELNAEHSRKMAAMNSEIDSLKREIQENKELLQELEKMKREREKEEAAAMKPVRELEKELSKLESQLATAGKSREDGLTSEQIAANQSLWEARDELDDVEDEINKLALECMMLEHSLKNKIGESKESDSSGGSNSDSDSDSDSSDDSDSDSSSDKSESEAAKAEHAAQLAAELQRKQQEETERLDREAFDKEYKFFRDSLTKEEFLQELLQKIVAYLEYGTNVTILTEKGFSRHFLFVTRSHKVLGVIPEVLEGVVPQKKTVQRQFNTDDVAKIILGQHSKMFQELLKTVSGRIDPPRNEVPPEVQLLSPSNVHRYYYRSFSLVNTRGESLDIIADTQTDFEALITALHRLTRQDANWGKRLYIDFCERFDELMPFEKKFCEESHLTPEQYLSAKDKILMNDELLFITLHDIRLMTSLDLYHSQRILELFMGQKWVVRRQLNFFRHHEALLKSADSAAKRMGSFVDPNANMTKGGISDTLI